MRGNWKAEDAGYTLFQHGITYSTKPLEEFRVKENEDDTPSARIKLKRNYYYEIFSRLED